MISQWKILEHDLTGDDLSRIRECAEILEKDPLIAKIAYLRGYRTPEQMYEFINTPLSMMNSPFAMDDMHEAVIRIKKAVAEREKIGIFADSDLDGITSLTVMYNFLEQLGITPFYRYLKDDETYGLTFDIVDEFIDSGLTLLITVDSGIRDIKEIRYARDNNIDVIVTDHHEPDELLPDALILNPKLVNSRYPCRELAGVGVVFKLCLGTLQSYLPTYNRKIHIVRINGEEYETVSLVNSEIVNQGVFKDPEQLQGIVSSAGGDDLLFLHGAAIPDPGLLNGAEVRSFLELFNNICKSDVDSLEGASDFLGINRKLFSQEMDLLVRIFFEIQIRGSSKILRFINDALPLVSIGTIADVMPMTGENRLLVRSGMEMLNIAEHRGLRAMLPNERVSTRDISWHMAPMLNTPGRYGQTSLTVDFFLQKNRETLDAVIREIESLNASRKDLVKRVINSIQEEEKSEQETETGTILTVMRDDIPDGMAGLIANRLADEAGKPVIVFSMSEGNSLVKGSARARGGINFFSRIMEYSQLFDRIGGHEQAFGFTIEHARIPELLGALKTFNCETENDLIESADALLVPEEINGRLYESLAALEPFGKDNLEPVFCSTGLGISSFRRLGDGNHGRYGFTNGSGNLYAIGWNMGNVMEEFYRAGDPVDIYYSIEKNEFRGVTSTRLNILEIQKSES